MTEHPPPDGWRAGDVEVDGVRLRYYRSGGDGRPFVLAHGVTSSGRSRLPLVEDLAGEYDVVTYDARGHGDSDAPDSGYGYGDQAADLLGLIEALDLADPVLYGHSMGGSTVATAAAERPDLPRAVILEDPEILLGLDGDDGPRDGEDDSGDDEDDPEDPEDPEDDPGLGMMFERIHGEPASSPGELLELDPELRGLVDEGREHLARLLAEAYLNVDPSVGRVFEAESPDPAELFPEIRAPTLVLKADAGDPAARERHRRAASHLPEGRLVHVDGAGHCVLREEYERAYGTVREFLDDRS